MTTPTVYEFDATNRDAQSVSRNTVTLSLSTFAKAQAAQKQMVDFGCTVTTIRILAADTDVALAVGYAKQLLR